MKYTALIGTTCLLIGIVLFFFNVPNMARFDFWIGSLLGTGGGFLFGGFFGNILKKNKLPIIDSKQQNEK